MIHNIMDYITSTHERINVTFQLNLTILYVILTCIYRFEYLKKINFDKLIKDYEKHLDRPLVFGVIENKK